MKKKEETHAFIDFESSFHLVSIVQNVTQVGLKSVYTGLFDLLDSLCVH